ncbi:uncharacterized protein LOC113334008 [Papaver somniferum]|uniref:uncharacterized protein LOC113334008 n=1 Tax=Papaver somniferum TaxID=3469 RepID=UPI000E6FE05A|nr:uncharacterized protein LOC113334008 [Papaver somniferum]
MAESERRDMNFDGEGSKKKNQPRLSQTSPTETTKMKTEKIKGSPELMASARKEGEEEERTLLGFSENGEYRKENIKGDIYRMKCLDRQQRMDISMENTQAYLSLSNSVVEETSDEEVVSNTSDEDAVPSDDDMVLNNPIIRTSRELKNEERLGIYQYLLTHSNNERVERGSIQRVATIFKTSVSIVSRIWNRSKENQNPNMPADVSSRKPTRVGRKRVEIDRDRVLAVPLNRRTCLCTLAAEIEMSTTTLHRRVKEGKVKPHTSAVRPALKDDGKIKRLNYCIDMLDTSTFDSKPMFKDMYDYVHIDEKWFNMTKISQRYYLLPDEPKPHRECQKRFIPKIMFTAAVARPQYDSSGNLIFDGRIGIWAMVKVPAARNSKNRKAGTLETKPIDPVDKKVLMEFLIGKVLPAIRAKWPTGNTRTIYIQQDNAKPHISKDDRKI